MKGKEKILIHLIAAARPNFMKVAPLYHALKCENWVKPVIVHTGQHYDLNMSDVFFHDLGLDQPDIHLGIGSGSHAEQTGRVMIAYEKILLKTKPDLVVVVGDVNATLACTIAALKVSYSNPTRLNRPIVAHLEAGLRSFDKTMPEEINRMITDTLADILWTPSPDADENLFREGISSRKVVRVGNIMIDSFKMLQKKIDKEKVYKQFGLTSKSYGLITFHRPSNVDDLDRLKDLCDVLTRISLKIPLIFPLHPRTKKSLEQFELFDELNTVEQIIITEPLNYIRFMSLVMNSRIVITDSGGIQEETTYLGIPCLTIRDSTERPITISQGTNKLCNIKNIEPNVKELLSHNKFFNCKIELWDGQTNKRVVESIKTAFANRF